MKYAKDFSCPHTITVKRVDLHSKTGFRNEDLGTVNISGVLTIHTEFPKVDIENRYEIDIDTVEYKGVNILPILEDQPLLDECYEVALKYAVNRFESREMIAV